MKNQENNLEEVIARENDESGAGIEEEIRQDPEISQMAAGDGFKERFYKDKEKYDKRLLLESLTDEDREALRLGRELLEKKTAKKKKNIFVRVGVAAAVLTLTLAIGITSVGGPRRIIEVLYQMIGSREVIKINSYREDKGDILESDGFTEEDAYLQIEEELGVNAVRVEKVSEQMSFEGLELDENLQTARLYYDMDGDRINYIITSTYADSSLSMDFDDKVIDTYEFPLDKTTVTVKEYEIDERKQSKYVAIFEYRHIYYSLIATLEKAEFELLLEKLNFP